MSASSLKKLVLPAMLFAGTVFASLTVPLAVFGSEPIDIHLNQEPIFSGKVKDFAAPYVGIVGLLSIGTGVAGVTVAGWKQSSSKSGQVETKCSHLQQKLAEKELQLETVMLSGNRLQASGLNFFLQDGTLTESEPNATEPEFEPVEVPTNTVTSSKVTSTQFTPAFEATPEHAAVPSVVSSLAAAQAFLSFTRSNGSTQVGYDSPPIAPAAPSASLSLQELQEQLKQIMTQVETLQSSIETAPQPVLKQTHQAAYTIHALEPLSHQPTTQPQWIIQPLAC
ncbi:MAG: hypothetical protein RBJ76_04540 [Stenomitos frigidus ULC029]